MASILGQLCIKRLSTAAKETLALTAPRAVLSLDLTGSDFRSTVAYAAACAGRCPPRTRAASYAVSSRQSA